MVRHRKHRVVDIQANGRYHVTTRSLSTGMVIMLLVLLCDPAFAVGKDTVCVGGSVVASDTRLPLAGVSVWSPTKHIGTYTKRDGTFRLCLPASIDTVTIQYVGYRRRTMAVADIRNAQTIVMTPDTLSGQPVIVTARRDPYSIIEMAYRKLLHARNGTQSLTCTLRSTRVTRNVKDSTSSIGESVAQFTVRQSPVRTHTITLIATRQLGERTSPVIFDDWIDPTDDQAEIRGIQYPLPLSPRNRDAYSYEYGEHTDGTYRILFEPVMAGAHGFAGAISVSTVDSTIRDMRMRLVNPGNFPFLDSAFISIRYDSDNAQLWLPVQENIDIYYTAMIVPGFVVSGISNASSSMSDIVLARDTVETTMPGQNLTSVPALRTIVDSIRPERNDSIIATYTPIQDTTGLNIRPVRRRLSLRDVENQTGEIPDGIRIVTSGSFSLSAMPSMSRSSRDEFMLGLNTTLRLRDSHLRLSYAEELTVSTGSPERHYGAEIGLRSSDSISKRSIALQYYRRTQALQRTDVIANNSILGIAATSFSKAYMNYYLVEGLALSTVTGSRLWSVENKASAFHVSPDHRGEPIPDEYHAGPDWLVTDRLTFTHSNSTLADLMFGRDDRQLLHAVLLLGANIENGTSFGTLSLHAGSEWSIVDTWLGDITLGCDAYGAIATERTPLFYQFSVLPKLSFFGRPTDLSTLTEQPVFGTVLGGFRLHLGFGEIVWRVLGLPALNHTYPNVGLFLSGLHLGQATDYTRGNIHRADITAFEAGCSFGRLPLFFTDFLYLDVEVAFRILESAAQQRPARVTFSISFPRLL